MRKKSVRLSLVAQIFALQGCGARTPLENRSPDASTAMESRGDAGQVTADAGPTVPDAEVGCSPLPANTTLVSLPWAGEVALPMAINDTNVYWLYSGPGYADGGTLMTTPKCGGGTVVLATGQPFPGGIAVDSEHVYWTNLSSQNQGSVMSLSLHGSTPVTLVAGGSPADVTVDATNVYWTDASSSSVMKLAKAGGAATTLATRQFGALSIAVNSTDVCWTRNGTEDPVTAPAVLCVGLTGGAPRVLTSGSAIYWELALDESNAYAISGDGSGAGSLISVPTAGGVPITLGSGFPAGVTVDETNVYWTSAPETEGMGTVVRVPKQGGNPETLAVSQSAPGAVAVDAQRFYWTNDPSVFVDAGPAVLAGPK